MCHMSCVKCQMSQYFFSFSYKVEKIIGGGSVINGAYHVYFWCHLNVCYRTCCLTCCCKFSASALCEGRREVPSAAVCHLAHLIREIAIISLRTIIISIIIQTTITTIITTFFPLSMGATRLKSQGSCITPCSSLLPAHRRGREKAASSGLSIPIYYCRSPDLIKSNRSNKKSGEAQ